MGTQRADIGKEDGDAGWNGLVFLQDDIEGGNVQRCRANINQYVQEFLYL